MGKTRLVDELASRAKDLGAGVLWGRCSKQPGAPALWPWTQALEPLGDAVPKLDADGESERFRLFVEVAGVLQQASRERPLLVVLDDVHRAEESSLLLLEFLAGEVAEMHVAIVATYVETANEPRGLAALADHTAHHRLRLAPLGPDDVARFLRAGGRGRRRRGQRVRRDGRQPAPRLAARALRASRMRPRNKRGRTRIRRVAS